MADLTGLPDLVARCVPEGVDFADWTADVVDFLTALSDHQAGHITRICRLVQSGQTEVLPGLPFSVEGCMPLSERLLTMLPSLTKLRAAVQFARSEGIAGPPR